jgi:hypothetical protein
MREKVGEEANRLDMKIKDYVQNALVFFVTRKINPATYDPGKEFDLVQIMKQSSDKMLNKIAEQEDNVLMKITEEMIRTRLLQEAQINILIEKLIEPEFKEKMQKEIAEYVEETLKSYLKK